MRIETTEARERLYADVLEATDESYKSKAIDKACRHYVRVRGNTTAYPTGTYQELLNAAADRGSLTAPEIAKILSTSTLEVSATVETSVGNE